MIIGLIVGGILAGQALITSAKIQKTITEKRLYETSTVAFSLRYGCLPGDCVNPIQKGFSGGNGTNPVYGGIDNIDGDGIIYRHGNQEAQYWYWQQLFEAGFISKSSAKRSPYIWAGDATPDCPICSKTFTTDPALQTFNAGGWMIADLNTIPYLNCGDVSRRFPQIPSQKRSFILSSGNLQGVPDPTVKPSDAAMLDSKIDDGRPLTGSVWAIKTFSYYSDPACSGNFELTAFEVPIFSVDQLNNIYLNNNNFIDLVIGADF